MVWSEAPSVVLTQGDSAMMPGGEADGAAVVQPASATRASPGAITRFSMATTLADGPEYYAQ